MALTASPSPGIPPSTPATLAADVTLADVEGALVPVSRLAIAPVTGEKILPRPSAH